MVKLQLPNQILNDTPADATPVDQNYSYIQQYINTETISRDGSVAMQAQLHLFGDPVNALDAASKGYVDALLPVGVMLPFCGQVAPAGSWALCNGASLATATYPKAFAVLGYRYGGSGGTFMIPNMAGRFPIGMDAAQTEFSATGKKGGTFTVPVPLHSHTMAHTHEHVHTHTMAHTHTINPPSATTSASGAHQHNGDIASHGTVGGNSSVLKLPGAGTNAANIVDASVTHTHTVDIAQFTSGASSAASTGAASDATSGQPSAASTANAGTSGVEMQPPFVVINYIVRID